MPDPDSSSAAAPALDPNRWRSLAVILSAAFLVGLDFFVVNVAIPSIQADLHATFAQIQLIIASYGLTYAVLLISGGRMGDIYGRKRMFMLGIGGFMITSLFWARIYLTQEATPAILSSWQPNPAHFRKQLFTSRTLTTA